MSYTNICRKGCVFPRPSHHKPRMRVHATLPTDISKVAYFFFKAYPFIIFLRSSFLAGCV